MMFVLTRDFDAYVDVKTADWKERPSPQLRLCLKALLQLFRRDQWTEEIAVDVSPKPYGVAQVCIMSISDDDEALFVNARYTEMYKPVMVMLSKLFIDHNTTELFVTFYNADLEPLVLCTS